VEITWMEWFLAAIVPGLISLVLVPFVLYKIYPPKVKETPNAKSWADGKLAEIGKMTLAEKIMAAVFVFAILLWLVGSKFG
ncbi:anion permease, partial [Klebsiella pneumoniae]